MQRGKTNKIQFVLCWILFVTQFSDATEQLFTKPKDSERLVLPETYTPSGNQETPPSNITTASAKDTDDGDENIKNCNSSDVASNLTQTSIKLDVNNTDNMNKILKVIDVKLNLTSQETVEGFAEIKRIKKETPVTQEAQSPKMLKKKETGHGKIFLLSSIISSGDKNNFNRINKRSSQDDANHGWKFRKPINFQKITKPLVTVSNQDSNKLVYEIINKTPSHDKKTGIILPARFETINSNLLIDYLFPSMFKNIFSQINHQTAPSSQTGQFNEIGYTDKLLDDGWLNLKEENPPPVKCTCNRLKNLDTFDLNNKLYPKEKISMFHIGPHVELYKQDRQYENSNAKDLNDKTMDLSLEHQRIDEKNLVDERIIFMNN